MNSLLPPPDSFDVASCPATTPSVPVVVPNAEPCNERSIEARLFELEQLAQQLHAMDDSYEQEIVDLNVPDDFRLSIVVPVYNEETTIRSIIAKLLQLDLPLEVIVVDDGSTDQTRAELSQLEGLPNLKIILKPANEGKGAALRTGFEHVEGTVVLVQDADLEYDPRDIPGLLQPLVDESADVVYGSRFLKQRRTGSSSVHRLGNWMLTAASNLTTGLRLTDMETCYKAFRAHVLDDLTVRQNRFGFEPEVTAKLARRGLKFVEVPICYAARDWDEGKKIGVRDAFNALFCILRYAWAD